MLLWHSSYILILYFFRRFSSVQDHFLLKVIFFFFVIAITIQFLIAAFRYLRFFNYMNYFLFCIFVMLLNVLILFLKISFNIIWILDKLNIILLILIIGTVSIFDNLNSNVIWSKAFFQIIWAFFHNLISLQLIFQSPLSLGFCFSIKTLFFIILAFSLIIVTHLISIVIILYNEIYWNHWGENALLRWIWNLTFALSKYFNYSFIFIFLYLLI